MSPVSLLQPGKLVTYNTPEGGSQQTTGGRGLSHAANEEINVIHSVIDQLEPLDNLLRDEVLEVIKLLNPLEATELSEGIVTRQTVISATLKIEGNKIEAEAAILGLEQVVGHLLGEDVVKLLPGLGGQTHQELVQLARSVDQAGVEEGVGERNHPSFLALIVNLLDNAEMCGLSVLKYHCGITTFLVIVLTCHNHQALNES